jgi:uroporphyrinogen-III synthase
VSAGVVITRPQAQAAPLAARLAGLGIPADVFPLLDIQPLDDSSALEATLARLHDYALVAFVSPNAVDAAFRYITRWPDGVIAAVVGEGSRQALARHGLTEANAHIAFPTDPNRTDSETLLEVLDLDALRGRKALIVRAETGRELLSDRLRAAGIAVDRVAAYRRGAPPLDAARRTALAGFIAAGSDWVITSSEALRNLQQDVLQLAGEAGWDAIRASRLIVPHQRIAETAQAMGFARVTLTGSGDEALLAALQSRT